MHVSQLSLKLSDVINAKLVVGCDQLIEIFVGDFHFCVSFDDIHKLDGTSKTPVLPEFFFCGCQLCIIQLLTP